MELHLSYINPSIFSDMFIPDLKLSSSALAMELHLSYINPSIFSDMLIPDLKLSSRNKLLCPVLILLTYRYTRD